jgi:hypothetical protein
VANSRPLWERQPWDSASSFAAFQVWLLQAERPRSLDAAYRVHVGRESYASGTPLRASNAWRRWYQGRDPKGERRLRNGRPVPTWSDRAQAYDDHLAELDRQKWEQRRAEVRESDWLAGVELRDLAAQVLAQSPQFVKTARRLVKGGKGVPDREVITLALDGTFLLKAIGLASELQRQAAEVIPPTQRLEHTGADGGPIQHSQVTIYLPDNGRAPERDDEAPVEADDTSDDA